MLVTQLLSKKPIKIERYVSVFEYETMSYYNNEFIDFFSDTGKESFFKANDTCNKKSSTNKECQVLADFKDSMFDIEEYKERLGKEVEPKKRKIPRQYGNPPFTSIGEYVFKELILKKIFANGLFNLMKESTNRNTLFILPYSSKPFINFLKSENLLAFYNYILKKDDTKIKKDNKLDIKNNLNYGNNSIAYIDIFPDNTTDSDDVYEDKIKAEINKIKAMIVEKLNISRIEGGTDKYNSSSVKTRDGDNPYTKIIWIVNQDKTFFTNYYKTPLPKKYATILNKYINDFYSLNSIDSKQVINDKPKEIFEPLKTLATFNIIAQDFKSVNPSQSALINNYRNPIIDFLNKLELIYSIRLDVSKLKDLTSLDNSTIFNIYMRFDNIDFPLITDEVIPNSNILYIFKSDSYVDRVGYFVLENKNRNQYRFVLDTIEYKYFKESYKFKKDGVNPTGKWENYVEDFTKRLNPSIKNSIKSELDEEESKFQELQAEEEELKLNPNMNPAIIPKKSFIVEIRYVYGKIQYRYPNQAWNSKNTIQYYKTINSYENYTFFNHRMIDTSFKDNINIKYFTNILYNRENLTGFLKSQQKYNEKTRLSYEFLNINNNLDMLNTYNSYIFDNYKYNIDERIKTPESTDTTFEESIKKGICDILFENSGLVYIKNVNRITDQPKEKASSDNYKISDYKFYKIIGNDTQTKTDEIIKYFKKNKNENKHLICNHKMCNVDNELPPELTSQLKKQLSTISIAVVTITKELEKSTTGIWFASECKSRKKKIKQKWYDVIRYFKGVNSNQIGGYTKKKIKRRRTYSSKYRKE